MAKRSNKIGLPPGTLVHIGERIRSSKGRIRKMKVDYLAYALTDAIIDNYLKILEKIGKR
ncbi:MAG: hypothetical protein SVM80_08410 [Halobacteriota archaeon]|nr:hypothetical protein [Halobacteriota archaeon]